MVAKLTPIEGWGFAETLKGTLAGAFTLAGVETGIDAGGGILGWRGMVADGRYKGMMAIITPRHVEGADTVVVNVSDDGKTIFSGMADAKGLRRTWK